MEYNLDILGLCIGNTTDGGDVIAFLQSLYFLRLQVARPAILMQFILQSLLSINVRSQRSSSRNYPRLRSQMEYYVVRFRE
jgi:hypothetical protein